MVGNRSWCTASGFTYRARNKEDRHSHRMHQRYDREGFINVRHDLVYSGGFLKGFPILILQFGLLPLEKRPCLRGFAVYHSVTEGFSPIYLLFDLAESCWGGIPFSQFQVFLYTAIHKKSLEGTVYPPHLTMVL